MGGEKIGSTASDRETSGGMNDACPDTTEVFSFIPSQEEEVSLVLEATPTRDTPPMIHPEEDDDEKKKLPSANDIFAEFNFMMAHSGPAAPGNRTARQSGYGQPEFNPSSNLQFDHQNQLDHQDRQEFQENKQLLHSSQPPQHNASHAQKDHPDHQGHQEPQETQEKLETPGTDATTGLPGRGPPGSSEKFGHPGPQRDAGAQAQSDPLTPGEPREAVDAGDLREAGTPGNPEADATPGFPEACGPPGPPGGPGAPAQSESLTPRAPGDAGKLRINSNFYLVPQSF
ncbi:Protein CBG11381 [Caenorhabditis briggsae]|uniref:Protein CBG11381 n=1 Tax=Caenorhabditis briggsae TaxID=6238 RepID=A8XD54_CAEBR|nr:Protein CBG11381 [Caenorhabditis briggsae]CAP30573.1 Protein CBG11381 [Caenorhabditis briggsae]